jgi:EKC/KEOPS complex subunit CGI121/TPRKB
MALESINLEHLPASHTVNAALFRDVKNASFLHQQLLAGNSDFEYAFIDASVVSTRPQPLLQIPVLCLPSILFRCTPFDIT